jgi:hypothetical protein
MIFNIFIESLNRRPNKKTFLKGLNKNDKDVLTVSLLMCKVTKCICTGYNEDEIHIII